ncbi:MAG TPA: hypothetical protein VHL58_20350 [Thermoanaerobaculia bacterium]|nr:hypothetical protein [Thermoanaerobaculia bacterium]
MMTCTCKKGFFILRDCGRPSVKNCRTCQREVCEEHLSKASGVPECLDCAARKADDGSLDPSKKQSSAEFDRGWTYGYRHREYSRGYHPIYWGSYRDPYYNDYDFRSFDRTGRNSLVADDDDSAAGFGDS